jgi:Na+-driven multidrug efflux pump
MTGGFVLFQVCPEMLLNLFGANQEMLDMGIPALRLISLCFIPASFGIITGTLFQATGHGVYSLMVSFIRQLVGILPIAYFLYNAFGVAVSWMSFPLAECLGLTVSVIMLTKLYKKEIKTLG